MALSAHQCLLLCRSRYNRIRAITNVRRISRRPSQFLLLLAMVGHVIGTAAAQDPAAGIIPFSTQSASGYESVDLATGSITIDLPVRHKPGIIPFSYDLVMNSHTYSTNGVWNVSDTLVGNSLARFTYSGSLQPITCGGVQYHTNLLNSFVITDKTGAAHPIGPTFYIDSGGGIPSGCGVQSGSAPTEDGSGYTMVVNEVVNGINVAFGIYDKSGNSILAVAITDPDGNTITGTGGVYQDTLGATALTVTVNPPPTASTYQYTDAAGNTQTIQVNYSSYTQQTDFGCSNVSDIGPNQVSLVSSVSTPAGTFGFTYETTPNDTHNPHYVTGRVAGITYPSGGSVSYVYSGGNNNSGINCTLIGNGGSTTESAVVPTLTKTVTDASGNHSVWKYVNSWPGSTTYPVTVTDPANNQIVYTFNGEYQTQVQSYEGSSSTGTLLKTVLTCYNQTYGSKSACIDSAPGVSTTQTDVYTYLGSSTSPSLVETQYDTYGNVTTVKQYGFGAPLPPTSGSPVASTITAYDIASGGSYPCGSLAIPFMYNKPCSTTTSGSSGTINQTTYSYSQTGHPLTTSKFVSQTASALTENTSYNTNGTVNVDTDVNGTTTTYSYNGTCNNIEPTGVQIVGTGVNLSRSMNWDCNGGVQTYLLDENGHQTKTYFYIGSTADPFYRPLYVVDTSGYTTNFSYSTTTFESAMNFNSGYSTTDVLTTTDGLGRGIVSQKRQAPLSITTSFDSVQTAYRWITTTPTAPGGLLVTKSMPYSGAAGQLAPPGTPVTATQYDAVNRPLTITDGGGGTTSYTYLNNDVLQATGPTQYFQRQLEYDGLGRLTYVCEITSASGSNTCLQANSPVGYWTKYAYDAFGNVTVTQNAQATATQQETRIYDYDGLGRLTYESNPETGATYYTYDTDGQCGTSKGDLVKKIDSMTPAPNVTCYHHDGLHRVIGITYPSGQYALNTPSKTFIYDSTTFNCTNGANVAGKLAEAFTGPSAGKITDIGYCYSPSGQITDVFESTPNSNGTYHTSAGYFGNGTLQYLNGIPVQSAFSFGVDGEGRIVTAVTGTVSGLACGNSNIPLQCASYNTASQPTGVTLGSGDSDVWSYDPNTGRMNGYTFNVGPSGNVKSVVGNVNWNPNGTLGSLQIQDPFNTSNAQTCSYFYDNLGRLAGQDSNGYTIDCGTGGWQQQITLDAFGNISKSGNGAVTFAASYNTNNQETSVASCVPSYDAVGNMLSDCTFTPAVSYAWDADGNAITLGGVNITYDAFDRVVEQGLTQVLYTPIGKTAIMNGQTMTRVDLPLPGGDVAVYEGAYNIPFHYRHADWLGSARFASSSSQTMTYDRAFAPYGESYAKIGLSSDLGFTGQAQDSFSGLYGFLNRQYNPVQGRWISPDPSGIAAANPSAPQSWNRYAYVLNNPLATVDPTGLDCIYDTPYFNEINQDGSQASNNPGDGGGNRDGNPLTVVPGDCLNKNGDDDGIYVDGTISGGAAGINSSQYGTAGPDGYLTFNVDGQTDPQSVCIASDCTANIGNSADVTTTLQTTTSDVDSLFGGGISAANTGMAMTLVIQKDNGKSIPNVPPDKRFCSTYHDGTGAGDILYALCMNFPNSPKSNCMRGMLLQQFAPNDNPPDLIFRYGFYDHGKDFVSCVL